MSTSRRYAFIAALILFFGRGRGRGARCPAKLTTTAAPVKPVLPYNVADESGGRIYPVLRFRRRIATAKIKPVNGLRVEIFLRSLCLGWVNMV